MFVRHLENPIIVPGAPEWRSAAAFNPGAIYHNGHVFLYEIASRGYRPFARSIGMHVSTDGVHFDLVSKLPVIEPKDLGSTTGTCSDPRVVKNDDTIDMTMAYRPHAWHCNPTGVGKPESHAPDCDPRENNTRSALLTSTNLMDWKLHSWITPADIDDRNVVMFPEKIDGRFTVLRRPVPFAGPGMKERVRGSIYISFSDDLILWTNPEPVIHPIFAWEDNRIGAGPPPIKTEAGWLIIYHGVEITNATVNSVMYRVGLALLDLKDPRKVIARCPHPVMEPEEYYERFGSFIPNVIFPTAAPVIDGKVFMYYGCCDTAISLATASLDSLVAYVLRF